MKTIFVNVWVNNILNHNSCAVQINSDSCGIAEAAQLSVEIARENNVDISFVRFEIVK